MAIDFIDDNSDKNKNKNAPGVTQAPPAGNPVPTPTGSGSGTPMGNTPQASNQRKTGSGFTNLQNVLNANKQNQLGSTIGSGIQNIAGNVRQNLGSSQQEFQQNVDQNALNSQTNQDYVNNTLNGITNVNTTGQGPNVQQADVDKFASLRAGQYTGPTTLRNQDELAQQAQRAQSLGQNVGSAGGNQALLQQFVGNRPGYSTGQQKLDSLLLGKTGAQPLQQARQSTFGLNNLVTDSGNTAAQIAQTQANLNKQFGQDLTNKLGQGGTADTAGTGLIGGIVDPTLKVVNDKNTAASTEYNSFIKRLTDKQLNQDDVEKIRQLTGGDTTLGLSPDDLAQAFSQGKYTNENVIGTQKAAQLQALQKLAGREDLKLDPNQVTDKPIQNVNEDLSKFGDQRQKYLDNKANFDRYQNLIDATNYKNQNAGKQFDTLQSQMEAIQKNAPTNPFMPDTRNQQIADLLTNASKDPNLAYNAKLRNTLNEYSNMAARGMESGGSFMGANVPDYMNIKDRLLQVNANTEPVAGNLQKMLDLYKNDAGFKGEQSLSSLMNPEAAKLYNQEYHSKPQDIPGSDYEKQLNEYYEAKHADLVRASDKNLKKNIKSGDKPVENFLDMIKPHQYDYKNPEHGEGKQLSVMAQDLEKSPEGKQAVEDSPEGKKVNYGKLAAMMLASQANIHDRLKKLESKKK